MITRKKRKAGIDNSNLPPLLFRRSRPLKKTTQGSALTASLPLSPRAHALEMDNDQYVRHLREEQAARRYLLLALLLFWRKFSRRQHQNAVQVATKLSALLCKCCALTRSHGHSETHESHGCVKTGLCGRVLVCFSVEGYDSLRRFVDDIYRCSRAGDDRSSRLPSWQHEQSLPREARKVGQR